MFLLVPAYPGSPGPTPLNGCVFVCVCCPCGCSVHEAMPVVVDQLSGLWSLRLIKLLFDPLFTYVSALVTPADPTSAAAAATPSPTKSTQLQSSK